jgi:hypothetical protein
MPHLLVEFRMFGLLFLIETGFELKISFELASYRMLSNYKHSVKKHGLGNQYYNTDYVCSIELSINLG